jgi:glycosyltransferase involved in cell wall biosynthesis
MAEGIKNRRIILLSNSFDEQYDTVRGEKTPPTLAIEKRRRLLQCLELATGCPIIVLSSPPKASKRRLPRWLAPAKTRFDNYTQFICANWDIPKLRIPLSWLFYALHVVQHTRDGDIILIDNYEIVYVIGAWAARFRRKVRFVLDYEDGKHLVDKGVYFLMSRQAEMLGRRLLAAALVAAPALQKRLPPQLPVELVPGFYVPPSGFNRIHPGNNGLRFLYSGSLDTTRGVDLLLAAVGLLPASGWQLHITGAGELEEQVRKFAQASTQRVLFHGKLSAKHHEQLLHECHVGLNCQRTSDPISEVTFPSKVFSYLGSGLVVLSSRASSVPSICEEACFYYDEETPSNLAGAMQQLIEGFPALQEKAKQRATIMNKYSLPGTSERLRSLFQRAKLI